MTYVTNDIMNSQALPKYLCVPVQKHVIPMAEPLPVDAAVPDRGKAGLASAAALASTGGDRRRRPARVLPKLGSLSEVNSSDLAARYRYIKISAPAVGPSKFCTQHDPGVIAISRGAKEPMRGAYTRLGTPELPDA